MDGTRLESFLRFVKEQFVAIVGVIITGIITALVLSNLQAIREWLNKDIPLWISVVCLAWGTSASVYLLILAQRIRSQRTYRTGIIWQEHGDALFKVELVREGSRLALSRVAGLYCGQCKSRAEVWRHLAPNGPRGYAIFCPNCEGPVGVASEDEAVLKRIVGSVVEGRINRGDLTINSKSIEWLDSDE